MTTLVMQSADPHALLSHLALYGLAAIVEDTGAPARISWTPTGNPRPRLDTDLDATQVATLVQQHATEHGKADGWLAEDIELGGKPRGLMSPRITPLGHDHEAWAQLQRRRHHVIDTLTNARAWLDLRQLAALGEPCYWSRSREGGILQDDAASRLEMQPRNQGSEIVGSRLRKLATAVAARTCPQVLDGLRGATVRDEIGNDKPDSRTATGLASPGPTDNALAWCALWGISQFPLAMRVGTAYGRPGSALTTGHLGRTRAEWFYAPVWHQHWRPARLRTILASAHLATAAAAGLPLRGGSVSDTQAAAARAWLAARHVVGLMRFPINRFGSDSAPERRAMRGEPLTLSPRP